MNTPTIRELAEQVADDYAQQVRAAAERLPDLEGIARAQVELLVNTDDEKDRAA